jgi:hypothetical protein
MNETVKDGSTRGGAACPRCFMQVARFAPQVVVSSGTYHRECYEAWYFGRFGKRPRLLAGPNGDRHRYEARDLAA